MILSDCGCSSNYKPLLDRVAGRIEANLEQRILSLQVLRGEQQAAPAEGDALDAVRLDWLDKNIFYREMDKWDAKYGHGSGYSMRVLFAPKGHQGSARNIIDAAMAAQTKGKTCE